VINSTIRELTKVEKQQQGKKSAGLFQQIEEIAFIFIFIVLVLLAPLLIYDSIHPVASSVQAIYCIAIIIIALSIIYWIKKKHTGRFGYKKNIDSVNPNQVEVVRVKTTRAIKREDFEDFGLAYYIDVVDKERRKTLFLWGQYLDILEAENSFPNTEFEFIRKIGSEEFLDFKTFGQHFTEEKTLPAFDKEKWKSGIYPVNGELLENTIDEIQ
jgi:hypothetical protein